MITIKSVPCCPETGSQIRPFVIIETSNWSYISARRLNWNVFSFPFHVGGYCCFGGEFFFILWERCRFGKVVNVRCSRKCLDLHVKNFIGKYQYYLNSFLPSKTQRFASPLLKDGRLLSVMSFLSLWWPIHEPALCFFIWLKNKQK